MSQSWSPSASGSALLGPDTRPVTLLLQPSKGAVLDFQPPATEARLAEAEKRMTARREEMVYKSVSMNSIAPVEPPKTGPLLLEGYVVQMPGRIVRKLVLTRDKLTILTSPGLAEPAEGEDAPAADAFPLIVYSFPLRFLRFEKENSFGMRLFDTRKGELDDGVLILNETEDQNACWIDNILEAIYSDD